MSDSSVDDGCEDPLEGALENRLEERQQWTIDYRGEGGGSGDDILALLQDETGLSRAELKRCMQKGALWRAAAPPQAERGGNSALGRPARLRRRSAVLRAGDQLYLYYAPEFLAQTPLSLRLVEDLGELTVWDKPAGMRMDGSKWGDHLAFARLAERQLGDRPSYPVHRLDQWTRGLVLLAHSRRAAREASRLFAAREVEKRYRALIATPLEQSLPLTIEREIDGKPARSTVLAAKPATAWLNPPAGDPAGSDSPCNDIGLPAGASELSLRIDTGRCHQIREHLASLGRPLLGDRLFAGVLNPETQPSTAGQRSSQAVDLQLAAVELGIVWGGEQRHWVLELA